MRLALALGVLAVAAVAAASECGALAFDSAEADEEIHEAIREQLPDELPPHEEVGWPQHAFTMAITWYRIGEEALALEMADELWERRDPDSGLWRNGAAYVDATNPFFATLLFELLGQHDRAVKTSDNVIRYARSIQGNGGAYNEIWFAALSAAVVGKPPPSDLMTVAYDGLMGSYSIREHGTARGRYYGDIMRAYWCATGGKCREPLSDETDYCQTLARGRQECESFYAWSRGESNGADLGDEEYSFWTDGILFYALSGLELEFGTYPTPFRSVVPGISYGGQ